MSKGPLTQEYHDGRLDGHSAVDKFGLHEADAMVAHFEWYNPNSLYLIAFRRSVNERAWDQAK